MDRVVRGSRIAYPIFFGLIGLFLYLLAIPFMIVSNNLQSFLSEPMWVLVAMFGALNGILTIFVYREFSYALSKTEHLMALDDFQKVKSRLLGYLTNRVYWIVVIFWLILNLIEAPRNMRWWWFYNQPNLVTAYELIETLPCCVIGGIFMYIVPVGLVLAYRSLCLKTPFKKGLLASEWMKPFKDFRRLITLIMLGAAVYAVFPPAIWGSVVKQSIETRWSIFIPYTSIVIVLVSAILLPHYFFHRLFSDTKENLYTDLQEKISEVTTKEGNNISREILLLLEKGEIEKLKTWLIDVKFIGEILTVAIVHAIIVEVLTIFILR